MESPIVLNARNPGQSGEGRVKEQRVRFRSWFVKENKRNRFVGWAGDAELRRDRTKCWVMRVHTWALLRTPFEHVRKLQYNFAWWGEWMDGEQKVVWLGIYRWAEVGSEALHFSWVPELVMFERSAVARAPQSRIVKTSVRLSRVPTYQSTRAVFWTDWLRLKFEPKTQTD